MVERKTLFEPNSIEKSQIDQILNFDYKIGNENLKLILFILLSLLN